MEKPFQKQTKLFDQYGEVTKEAMVQTPAEQFLALTGVPLSSYSMLTDTPEGLAELENILRMSKEEARNVLIRIAAAEDKNEPPYWYVPK